MGRIMMVMGVAFAFLIGAAGAQAAFTAPTADQIKAAADDPAKIKALLTDATPAQAADVLLQVVKRVQGLAIKLEQKKDRVAKLFAATSEAMGKNAGAVVAEVAQKIDASLLPTVAAPGAGAAPTAMPLSHPLAVPIKPGDGTAAPATTPAPPPTAPTYSGQ